MRVGESTKRKDGGRKVAGLAEYPSDVDDGERLHAAVLRSNVSHGRLVEFRAEGARSMPEVEAVVSREELLGGFDPLIRHHGDVVAAIAAKTPEAAAEAIRRIEYRVERLDPIHDPETAFDEEAPQLHQSDTGFSKFGRRHAVNVENPAYARNVDDYHRLELGDVDAGFEAASFVHEGEYRTPRVAHCNLDTHFCLATWNQGTLELFETIGAPRAAERKLSKLLDVDEERISVDTPATSGSSFGGRSLPKLTVEPVAATLAKVTERPVQLQFDREEEFVVGESRHWTRCRIKTGVSAEGKLEALEIEMLADTGGYPNGVGHIVLTNSMERPLDLYDVSNYRFEGVSVYTNNPPAGEYRGIGVTQMTFALESHVDEVAREIGMAPDQFRRQNFVSEGDERPHTGVPIESCGLEECLARGMKTFSHAREGSSTDRDVLRGTGIAAGAHTTGSGSADKESSEARIQLDETGRFTVETPAVDLGQGSDTVLTQIVAEGLNVPPARIHSERFSPDAAFDDDLGSVASRTTYVIGMAALKTAKSMRALLEERAAVELGVEPRSVQLQDDVVVSATGASIPLTEVVRRAEDDRLVARERVTTAHTPPGYGIHFAAVEVDRRTGAVDVLTYVAAQDVGFAINPKLVEGQLEGAVSHGIEFALSSELRIEQGVPKNANLADYPVISPWEMPDTLACELIESNERTGPFGAKGVGTPSLPPVAPAILNAIRDATGIRFTEPPVDSEAIYFGINDVSN
ncbi:xanthine dehydrogenase family protein molybdopterin-binding subunit [Salinigranum marinum]|uniref:xanthine dehydrogenase family protein molybdopterin-binding subunit n=1 Tax=Salinigranum marinum TaxID=1515595 RepID=UPI002989FBAE|nr:molybdopterin cofactor-binding domain-containing protein [Salinigranum marinum]